MKGFFTVVDDDDVFVTLLDSMQLHGSSSSCWFAGQLEYRLNSILWNWFILYGGKALVLSINWVYSCFTVIEHQQNSFIEKRNEDDGSKWNLVSVLNCIVASFERALFRMCRTQVSPRSARASNNISLQLGLGFWRTWPRQQSSIHTYHSYYTGAEDTTIAR